MTKSLKNLGSRSFGSFAASGWQTCFTERTWIPDWDIRGWQKRGIKACFCQLGSPITTFGDENRNFSERTWIPD